MIRWVLLAVWLAGCAPVVALPASMPMDPPLEEPPPAGLLRPLDPARPDGDQVITRAGLEALAARLIRQRTSAAADLAECSARAKEADDRAVAASGAADAGRVTAALAAVGGAVLAVVVETLVVFAIGSAKAGH